jgi:cardiolipin synthase
MFEMMRQAGVEVREYADPLRQFWDLNDRWHEKHLIVDGATSIEGGMNIASEYALGGSGKLVYSRGETGTEPWRDTDLQLEGPAVHDAQQAFVKNWNDLGKDVSAAERARLFPTLAPISGGATVRAVQARPDEEGQPNVDALYLHAINAAKKSITIENAYFVPTREIREALAAAARRGVEVKVMTNSRASNDFGAVSDAGRYFYDPLIEAGVKIHERVGSTLHSKTATFDGAFSIVGSANLNGRSKGRDSEFVLAISSPDTAAQLERRFDQGLAQTQRVTASELRNEGFFTNLKQWALSTLAWTF